MSGILAIHIVALLIFGGFTVYDAFMPDDASFDDPPPLEKIERVQLEFKVRMQEKQKQSQRPKQKLQVQQISQMEVPDVDIQVPDINNGRGIGRFGDGNFGGMGGGLGLGDVSVDLFDIRAKGEKFLFVVDVRSELLQDAKGGIPTYNVIKEDITRLVNELPSGVLFNMILFDRERMETFRPNLVPASAENKKLFANWLAPVNLNANSTGIRRSNFRPQAFQQPVAQRLLSRTNQSAGLRNVWLLSAVAGFEQKPDAIFYLSDHLTDFENVEERITHDSEGLKKAREEYLDRIEDATDLESIEEYQRARSVVIGKRDEKVRAFQQRENQQRARKGVPPRVYSMSELFQLRRQMEEEVEDELEGYVPHVRGLQEYQPIPAREIEDWIEQNQRLQFDQSGDERPQFNAIIFRGKDEEVTKEEENVIDDFVDTFGGNYRILKGLGAIDSDAVR
ncbi:MAG: hypothetical protein AAGJ81_11145 [Verrucomicrobiota bacterium]